MMHVSAARVFDRHWHFRLPARHYLILVLGCTAVVSLLVSTQWQYAFGVDALDSVRVERERARHVDSLLIALLDAETGVRGYLASGDRMYLAPYDDAVPQVKEMMATLRRETAGDPEMFRVLRELDQEVERKLEILSSAMLSGKRDIWSPETAGAGKRTMDSIRILLERIKLMTEARTSASVSASIDRLVVSRWVALALGVGAIALLISLHAQMLSQFRLRTQIAGMLRDENKRLEEAVAKRTSELSTMARYLSDIRENEKRRLARELHDELGALLTSAKMDAGWIARKIDAASMNVIRERFERLVQQLNSGIALKRRIIDNLHPPLLEELGLISSLQSVIDDFERSAGVVVRFAEPVSPPALAPDKSLALFRIVQESLTNIRKYARATSVTVDLAFEPNKARVVVEDNGQGFDPESVTGTHGLTGMRYRTVVFGGRLLVASAIGKGTRITAEIPL